MNQDFTVQKSNICLKKKKFVQRGSPKKKILHKQCAKKKNPCTLKIPLPPSPITFLMVRPQEQPSILWLPGLSDKEGERANEQEESY